MSCREVVGMRGCEGLYRAVAMPPGAKLPSNKYWIIASRDASDMAADQLGKKNSWSNVWGPEHCAFGVAFEPSFIGFDIVSITSLESTVPSQDLIPFVATKRPTREQRRSLGLPPLSTSCIVQFVPCPQGPLHIRSVAGGPQALEDFLEREPLSLSALPTPVGSSSRSTPIKRISSAQAPTRAKLRAAAPPTSPPRGKRNGGHPPHHQPVRLDAHTTTFSISYRRKGTQIGTPYLDQTHIHPWAPHISVESLGQRHDRCPHPVRDRHLTHYKTLSVYYLIH